MTCAWPRPAGCGGSFTPANSAASGDAGCGVGTTIWPPFGIHHALSPVFMLYAVMPPSSRGLRIEMPAIVDVPGAAVL